MNPRWVWQAVLDRSFVPTPGHRPGMRTMLLTLQCGHVDRRRGCRPVPSIVHCKECEACPDHSPRKP